MAENENFYEEEEEEEEEELENEEKLDEEETLADSSQNLNRTKQILQTIRQALDLKKRGGMTEGEFQNLKRKLLAETGVISSAILDDSTSKASLNNKLNDQALNQAAISLYSGELHELIVKQIEENFQAAGGQNREYMRSLVVKLIDLEALKPQDKPYLYNLIDVVCNEPETLEFGLRQIESIDEEVRKNISTSVTARALTGITSSSAKRAVEIFLNKPANNNKDLWNAVEEDFLGGLTGVGTSASIAALPGFALPALGFAVGVGAPILWVPAVGGLIGAGVTSGWKYARLKFGK